jgi:hypothetical protein
VETSGGRIGRGGRFDRASPHRKRARPPEPVRLPPNYRELSAGQAHDPRPAPRLHNPNEELVKYLELTSSYFRDVVFSNQPEGSRVPCLLLPDGRWNYGRAISGSR